ncbi:MAG TPA: heavy metal-binding domain-containing protein [Verrucomicrobiales bacterium]|nr:heavy metal-binding domain-containing protein [Verrucomicrobiales bacterium]HIL70298.1 heavy metal-binding domain-containing protein [Verrucomicrobiota bacterium]
MGPEIESAALIEWLNLFFVATPFLFLILAFITGKSAEKRHYRSIKLREETWHHIPAITGKQLPGLPEINSAELVVGSVVVSIDYFKRLLSGFRMIFGGEMKSYSSVIDRGRREAVLRMKEASPKADMFLNCRIETSTISNGKGKAIGCAEILAYATAVRFRADV